VIEARGDVPRAALASLDVQVASHKTLEDVVRWGLALAPPRFVHRVVVQDEFTHDVVMRFADGVYLVYDTT
jgi:hypothetical protein